jgi:hypothetical protein
MIKISKAIGLKTGKNPQLIVSGTQNPLVRNAKGEIEVLEGTAKRGGADVLYFQPPVSPSGEGYVGLSYILGGGEKEFKLSLFPDFGKKTILYGKSVIDKELFDMARILKEQGYSLKEAQNILNKYAKKGTVGATAKSAYGVETEFGATVGTRFELTGEKQFNVLEGTVVETRNIRRIKDSQKLNKVDDLYNEYLQTNNKAIAKEIERLTGINPSSTVSSIEKIPISNISSIMGKRFEDEVQKATESVISPKELMSMEKYISQESYIPKETKITPKERITSREDPYKVFQRETQKLIEEQIGGIEKVPNITPTSPSFPPVEKITIRATGLSKLSIPENRYTGKSKSPLGQGYYVYGKAVRTGKLFKINSYPLTKSRAEDVGAFYVTQTLAKTFIVKRANQNAQEDYEFAYIPQGYFKSQEYKLRNYRIKNKTATLFSEERFIQRGVYGLSSQAEKKQIQDFRKKASAVFR